MPSTTIRYSPLPENSQSIVLSAPRPSRHHDTPEPRPHRGPTGPAHHRRAPDPTGTDRRERPGAPLHRAAPDPGASERDPGAGHRRHLDPGSNRPPGAAARPGRSGEPPGSGRHRPGDTFEIGTKPHDPLDPGPYGTPGWRPDNRTGRHRYNELPDPPSDEHPVIEAPRRFSPMRENALARFLELSQPFHLAHLEPAPPTLNDRLGAFWRWLLWFACRALTTAHHTPPPSGRRAAGPPHASIAGTPTQERPRPAGPVPYIVAWERRFDAHFAIAGGVL